MASCKTCKHKKLIGNMCGCDGVYHDSCYMPKKRSPTNADRIRSMSDEELAAMLLDWQMNDQTANWCTDEQGCAGRGEGFECTDEKEAACIVRWLREPAGGAI